MSKKHSGITYYRQIADIIIDRIFSGSYRPGKRLPSDRELSEEFGYNRHTIRRALDLVEAQGLILRQQGKGTFVVDPLPHKNRKTQLVLGLIDITHEFGLRPNAELLEVAVQPADKVAMMLQIDKEEHVTYMHRLRYLNNEAAIIEYIYVSQKVSPGLEKYDLTFSLRSLLQDQYQLNITRKEVTFESVVSNSYVSRLLNIPIGSPMMLEKRVSYTHDGTACEYSEHIYRGDRFSFVLK
jgi:DNA-binding GntR family transcriptional regulator